VKDLRLVGILAFLAAGCACERPAYGPLPVERCETPEGTFQYFREAIASGRYTLAWWCLSREGRKAITREEFEAGFESYGAVRDLFTGSRIAAVTVAPDGERAAVRIENTAWSVRKTFRLVVAPVGRERLWHVDLRRRDLEELADQAQGYHETGRGPDERDAMPDYGVRDGL
jgi:hypothetical protein